MNHRLPRRLARTAAAATVVLVLAACADEAGTVVDGGPASTDPPATDHLVSGDGWRGALLDADVGGLELPDGDWLEDVDSFRPTEADVQRFEEQLPAALVAAGNPSGEVVTVDDLVGYVRQYTGVEGGGARHLVVAALCNPEQFPDWETQWIFVSDGGACFWDATMDLATGEILGLSFHGPA
jgi:hypothetical protein